MGVDIERRALVVLEKLQVANEVNYQERAEEKARESHNYFPANAAGECFGYPTHKVAKLGM
jgi:hypothetical protein